MSNLNFSVIIILKLRDIMVVALRQSAHENLTKKSASWQTGTIIRLLDFFV
jgi:hypothetical protein